MDSKNNNRNDAMAVSLIKDNRKLSFRDIERAKAVCSRVDTLVRERDDYVRRTGVDPNFAYPNANWAFDAPNDFIKAYRALVTGDPKILSLLRPWSQPYSGYNLVDMVSVKGIDSFRDDFPSDEVLQDRLEKENGKWLALWKHITQGLPKRCLFQPANMLGEIGHEVDGIIVNHDTAAYQERVRILYEFGIVNWLDQVIAEKGEVRILEIGGGYGALASWFKAAFPAATYTILDLPESLLFSSLYLSLTRPDISHSIGSQGRAYGIGYLPNFMASELSGQFDLIINTLSMSEMSEHQVRTYGNLISTKWLGKDGLFFEQNQDNRYMNLLCAQDIIKQIFPYQKSPEDFRRDGQPLPLALRPRHGVANVWSCQPISLPSVQIPGKPQPKLLEEIGSYNLVQAGETYLALRRSLGPVDPYVHVMDRDWAPAVFVGSSIEAVKAKIR